MGLFGLLRSLGRTKKQQLRILVLGLDNAGKTTIVKALCNEDITTINPTRGFNIKSLTHDKFKLNVWDIGGQKILREFWSDYLPNTHGLIYVIDSSYKKRVNETGRQLQNLLLQKQLVGVPILILANKQDLKIALEPAEILDQLKIGEIKTSKWTIAACSAKTHEGIQDGLSWLIQNIKK